MVFEFTLESSPHIIHELDAKSVTTRYYPLINQNYPQNHLTHCGQYVIETEEVDQTSYRLVSRKLLKGDLYEEDSNTTGQNQHDEGVHLDNFICYPSRFVDSHRFLLLGENDDEKMRLLIAPLEGRALEITPLPLSFNEAKRRLEAEWEKRRALNDKETGGTGEQSRVVEEDGSEEEDGEEDRNEEDGSEEQSSEEDGSEEKGAQR